jgi:hypothetical protein
MLIKFFSFDTDLRMISSESISREETIARENIPFHRINDIKG